MSAIWLEQMLKDKIDNVQRAEDYLKMAKQELADIEGDIQELKDKRKKAIQVGLSSCELLTYTDGEGTVFLLEHEGMLQLAVDEIYEALVEYEVF